VADWSIDDAMWNRLTREEGDRVILSGKAAARLANARREANRTVSQARGQEARFSAIVPADLDEPSLTRFQLYWETLERALADRPFTILDPQSTGRTHLFLADPERFNLNPLSLPQSFPPVEAPSEKSPAQ
jgi:regulator of protease activity HflC (stomatin/prohibitin superfamily)